MELCHLVLLIGQGLRDVSADREIGDQAIDVVDVHRRAEQVALHSRAAFRADARELLRGFDPFGDRRHAEAGAEAAMARDDRVASRYRARSRTKRTVDLDLVERESGADS